MARDLNLALIPGDGIGTEVVAEAMKVLDAVAPKAGINVSTTHYDLGATRYNATGELLPDAVIEELQTSDAIFYLFCHPANIAAKDRAFMHKDFLYHQR